LLAEQSANRAYRQGIAAALIVEPCSTKLELTGCASSLTRNQRWFASSASIVPWRTAFAPRVLGLARRCGRSARCGPRLLADESLASPGGSSAINYERIGFTLLPSFLSIGQHMPKTRKVNPWSPAQVKRLRHLAGRKTVKAIGRALKRSGAAVRFKAHTEGISLALR
jgi:hypothetical protein